MPNVWKFLSRPKAEPYRFPRADDLSPEEPEVPSFTDDEELESEQTDAVEEVASETESPDLDPVSYAQIQADSILREARRQAEALQDEARLKAEIEAKELYETARKEGLEAGHSEGVLQGTLEAMEENRKAQELQAAAIKEDVQKFLDQAAEALDRQLEEHIDDMRDLALAIAEKVISISLKSSSEVIGRMIQTAVEKRKRREWAQIYIAECDAKQMVKIPESLMTALSALSDRVRIIPMADDEAGTCIIEMPDEIIDASAATQLNNIRAILSDNHAGAMSANFNFAEGMFADVSTDDSSGSARGDL